MDIDGRVVERLQMLISEGERLLLNRVAQIHVGVGTFQFVDMGGATELFTKGQNILARVFGRESDHYLRFLETTKRNHNGSDSCVKAVAILRAALSDYEAGYLFDVKQLIHAEVLADLGEQASFLLKSGFHGPAAVVAGCVLEDALRTMCTEEPSISLPTGPPAKLEAMNQMLAKAGVYDKLVQKMVTAYADVRNKAAHGKWSEFTANDVADMIAWVSRFVEERLPRR